MKKELLGVVVCGGRSSRMGRDKGLLVYHNKPQRYHVYELLAAYCDRTVISISEQLLTTVAEGYEVVVDDARFSEMGPLTGLLSVHARYPHATLLVSGCDYPLVGHPEITMLLQAAAEGKSVAFRNAKGYLEPYISLLQSHDLQRLRNHHLSFNNSLKAFLEEASVVVLTHPDPVRLSSVDTPDAYEQITKMFRK